jgi:hypothetical protein
MSLYCRRQCEEFPPVRQDNAITASDDELIHQA